MLEIITLSLLFVMLIALLWLGLRVIALSRLLAEQPDILARALEEKHRLMLGDLHDGLNKQGDRMVQATLDSSERLREIVAQELKLTREAMQNLQLAQRDGLSNTREDILRQLSALSAGLQARQEAMRAEVISKTMQTMAEQGRADQELIQSTMQRSTEMLTLSIEGLTRSTDSRLEQISGKVGALVADQNLGGVQSQPRGLFTAGLGCLFQQILHACLIILRGLGCTAAVSAGLRRARRRAVAAADELAAGCEHYRDKTGVQ